MTVGKQQKAALDAAYTEALTGTPPTPVSSTSAPALDVIPKLSDAEIELARARAAVDAAEAALASAEFAREQAIAEEKARRDHEEDTRIAALRDDLARTLDGADYDLRDFRSLVAGAVTGRALGTTQDADAFDATRILGAWATAVTSRAIADRARETVLTHDATRAAELFDRWDAQVAEWGRMLDATLSFRHGGVLTAEEDDLEALAEVNATINEQSLAAPKALHRDPADRSTPHPGDLGIGDRHAAQRAKIFDTEKKAHLMNFATEFNNAVIEGAQNVARAVISRH